MALTPDGRAARMFSGRTFRVVQPCWAHNPLSGEGARRHGGRFNAPGTAAFYSSLDPHTAYAEYTQNLYDRPGLLCAFDIEGAHVADLRDEAQLHAFDATPQSLEGRWAGLANASTQLLAARISAEGYDGAIYSSLQHLTGSNLVLWAWNAPGLPHVALVDRLGEAIVNPIS